MRVTLESYHIFINTLLICKEMSFLVKTATILLQHSYIASNIMIKESLFTGLRFAAR